MDRGRNLEGNCRSAGDHGRERSSPFRPVHLSGGGERTQRDERERGAVIPFPFDFQTPFLPPLPPPPLSLFGFRHLRSIRLGLGSRVRPTTDRPTVWRDLHVLGSSQSDSRPVRVALRPKVSYRHRSSLVGQIGRNSHKRVVVD